VRGVLDSIVRDIRGACRSAVRRPGFSLLVVAILGLGIGASATILTIVYVLLVRPLPFKEADRLVLLRTRVGAEAGKLALREYRTLERDARIFDGVAAYYPSQYNLTTSGGPPEALPSTISTANLFEVLGTTPIVGSTWPRAADFQRRFHVVLSDGLWRRAFGGDPALVGKTIQLDRASYEVVGIAPPNADFPDRTEVFRSITDYGGDDDRRLAVVGRLKAGVTRSQAAAEIDAFTRLLAERYPDSNVGVRLTVESLRDATLGDARLFIALLTLAALLVVLLTCANVGNLLLARALERRTEVAVRLALGASKLSLARQLAVEGLVLALPASAAGAAIAAVALTTLSRLVEFKLPVWLPIEPGRATVWMTIAVAIAAVLVTSLAPMLSFARADLGDSLKTGARGSTGRDARRMLRALTALQTALAVMLLVFAGLLSRTVWRLLDTRLGFDAQHLLTFRADPPWGRYPDIATTSEFYRRAIETLGALPGVEGAATNQNLPLGRLPDAVTQTILVEGDAARRPGEQPFVNVQPISPAYFDVMRIPVASGRAFRLQDRSDTVPVAIVSATLARRYWPGQDAVGKRVRLATATAARIDASVRARTAEDRSPWLTVIGVAGDVKHEGITNASGLDVYLPQTQTYSGDSYFVLRTRTDPRALAAATTKAIQTVDPEQSVFAVAPMTDIVDRVIWQQRLVGAAFAGFASLALTLALAGLHGTIAQDVVRRKREIGVRLAMGASAGGVVRMFIGQSTRLVLIGCLAGLVVVAPLTRLASALLYEISPFDPAIYGGTLALVLVLTVAATWIAGRRAAGVSPLAALRD
jgi:predicted permease